PRSVSTFFLFSTTPTTPIYPLSLHDALPISRDAAGRGAGGGAVLETHRRARHRPRGAGRGRHREQPAVRGDRALVRGIREGGGPDRKSTRLNSSHLGISYAVFCLKKKKTK